MAGLRGMPAIWLQPRIPDDTANQERMASNFRTKKDTETYARRKKIAGPVFRQTKEVRGFGHLTAIR